ncbi:MAG: AMP-binding protein [Nitriliruptorales bacterium]|nr:AMP-binding protein [Nitriliruptorales bacterium]
MGSLVAVRLPPGAAFLAAWDRIWSAGDALLPLPHDAPDAVVARTIEELAPAALVVPLPGHPDRTRVVRLEGGRDVPAGIALVVATSGTTGEPKGVLLSHDAITASVAASIERLEISRASAWLSCLPWHHVAGLLTVLRSRASGGVAVVQPGFGVEAVRRDLDRVGWTSLVPTQLVRLLDADVRLGALDGILLGGAAAPVTLVDRARAAGARVVVSYGMTETCGGCVYDGVPLAGVTVGIDGEGRILVHGPVLADGYRDGRSGRVEPLEPIRTLSADGTERVEDQPGDGWFATEDLGVIENGRLLVLGRRDDVIVTGGENVSATAVRDRLNEHPSVQDAAVTGLPDPEWGTVVVAAVTCGAATPSVEELRAHVAEALGPHAAPRRLAFVDAIPRTALGKPDLIGLQKIF